MGEKQEGVGVIFNIFVLIDDNLTMLGEEIHMYTQGVVLAHSRQLDAETGKYIVLRLRWHGG